MFVSGAAISGSTNGSHTSMLVPFASAGSCSRPPSAWVMRRTISRPRPELWLLSTGSGSGVEAALAGRVSWA